MSKNSNLILRGPKSNYGMPEIPLGKYFFESFKAREPNEIINIDPITGETLTTGKLLENSKKLALEFNRLGLKRGDVISIVSENHVRYFESVFAALYLGVTVNAVNQVYTTNELRHCFVISKPKVVLCTEISKKAVLNVADELNFIEKIFLMYNRSSELESLEDLLELNDDIEDFQPLELNYYDDIAFILSSSGTTGPPKGTMITHQNVRTTIGYMCDPKLMDVNSEDTLILVPPFFHMYGIIMQFAGFFARCQVVIIDKFKPDVFLKAIQDYKPSKLFLVPPLLVFLAKNALVDNYDISSIQILWSGAAPAGNELLEEVCKRLGSVIIKQSYGLTETSGPCTIAMDHTKLGSVGCIIPDSLIKVRDPETHEFLEAHRRGELCIKGPMVVKGYKGNADATKNLMDEDGFVCSGDLGYYDEDGYFYIVDRLKELIKYKGFQVAPAELEDLIVGHPDVEDCAVVGIPDERAGQVPLAFVVPKHGTNLDPDVIVDYVAGRISIQKRLYGGVRFVKEIPKTPSGKIMRRKLLELQ